MASPRAFNDSCVDIMSVRIKPGLNAHAPVYNRTIDNVAKTMMTIIGRMKNIDYKESSDSHW